MKMIRQLLALGAFEQAYFIDHEVITALLVQYHRDRRNVFLLNLLSYEVELLSGRKPANLHLGISEEILSEINESTFSQILYNIEGSVEVNKLRLLWSCQRYYLSKYSLF